MFKPLDEKIPDFVKTKNFIENSILSSGIIKKYITIEKTKNPDNYIDIDKTLNDKDNIYKNLNNLDDNNFILSLFGKYIENNGTEVSISKKKDEKFKDIELASVQSLFSLGNQKKYELHFNFGKEINKKILNEPKEKEKFLEEWKTKLCKKLKIDKDKIILTDVHRGSVAVHAVILGSTHEKEKQALAELKQIKEITNINEKPMIEALQISPEILDKRGNRFKGWGINEIRGGEKYLPPLNGWIGIGLKVKNKYDNGNNDWLGHKNKKGEYAVGYIGINNLYNDKDTIIKDINHLPEKMDGINNKSYIKENNIRKKEVDKKIGTIGTIISIPLIATGIGAFIGIPLLIGSRIIANRDSLCGEGVCVFQNPDYAENSAGFIDVPGYRIKILLMCRVNPNKIRQPVGFSECWILNPNEIRPYRILIKKIPTSEMTDCNDQFRFVNSPTDYIIKAIKSNDLSFYNLSNEQRFSRISSINSQKVKEDFFVIRLYSSIYYKFINEYLRTKNVLKSFKTTKGEFKGFNEDQLNSWICCLHLALSRNKNVKDNTIVYRGIKINFSKDIGIGSKFYLQEFASTSLKKEFCEQWINHKGTIFIITIRNNGTNGHPNYCYYIEDITFTPNQYEVLISSHCYFTVTNITHEKEIDYVSLTCEGYLIE